MTNLKKASGDRTYCLASALGMVMPDVLFHRVWTLGVLFVAVACFCGGAARADGLSFGYEVLMESSQAAVIACPGNHETMMISTSFQDDTPLANQVWVVPVFSRTPPTVDAGKFEVFGRLAAEIDRRDNSRDAKKVIAVEVKKLDIFDVAILEADSISELVDWLVTNGYTVPDNVRGLLNWYITQSNLNSPARTAQTPPLKTYFIASRIDLRNRYAEIIDKLDKVYPGFSSKKAGDQSDDIYKALDKIRDDVEKGVAYEKSIAVNLISAADYQRLRDHWVSSNDYYGSVYYEVFSDYFQLTGTLSVFMSTSPFYNYGYAPTPLVIRFQPDQCFFPLRISSAAPDKSMRITLGVIASEGLYDDSGIMKSSELLYDYENGDGYFRKILDFDPEKNKLAEFFDSADIKGLKKISLFSRVIKPSELTADAVFMPVTDPNAIDFKLFPGINLVGNPFSRDLCAGEMTGDSTFFNIYDSTEDTGWRKSLCLKSCEGGVLKVKKFTDIKLAGKYADQDCINTSFRHDKGWHLVPYTSSINDFIEKLKTNNWNDLHQSGPFDLDSNTKTFRSTTKEVPGKAYWIYLYWYDGD